MAGIVKKDVWYYVLCTALISPFPLLLTFQDGMTAGTTALLAQGMLFTVLIAAMHTEVLEHASRGYQFLKNLPLTDQEVVRAKHVLPLGVVGMYLFYGYALLALFPVSERFFRLSRGYLVVVGNLSLLIVAVILYMVYRLGLLGLTKLASTVMSLAIGLLFIAGQFGGLRWARQGLREEDLHRLAELASGLNLFLICCAGLALFFGIMAASVRAKASREV